MHIIWFVAFERDSSRRVSLERDGSWKFVEQKLRKKKIHYESLYKSQCLLDCSILHSADYKGHNSNKTKVWLFFYISSLFFFSPISNLFVPGSKNTKRRRGNKISRKKNKGRIFIIPAVGLLGLRGTLSSRLLYMWCLSFGGLPNRSSSFADETGKSYSFSML